MIYQVRRGDRNLGDVALHRLEEAEISEGLLSADDATFSRLIRQEGSAARPSASNPSLDAYIKMRLECLADIIDTYDSKQMQTLLQKLRKLESAESDFGKVFVQLAEVVTYQAMRKQGQEDVVAPKKTRK